MATQTVTGETAEELNANMATANCTLLASALEKGALNVIAEPIENGCQVLFDRPDSPYQTSMVKIFADLPDEVRHGQLAAPTIFDKASELKAVGCNIDEKYTFLISLDGGHRILPDADEKGISYTRRSFSGCPIHSENQINQLALALVK